MNPENLYIGQGYDIHKLVEGRRLFLGGIAIPHIKGLLGHSDGDVLLHAISDAILGATCLGDIGKYFRETPELEGIQSIKILSEVYQMITDSGYQVISTDSNVIIQRPRLESYINRIRENISDILQIPLRRTSVKAKTADGIGSIGRGFAAEAHALVIMYK